MVSRWSDLVARLLERDDDLCDEAAAHIDDMHSWAGLMRLLDEAYPETVFPATEDRPDRDPGARIVSLLRLLDEARSTPARDNQETKP